MTVIRRLAALTFVLPLLAPAPAAHAGAVPGLPNDVAAAALTPEPALPAPAGWPFRDAFSRTSGTGRLIGGALEWTDWVYDAYGAAGTGGAPGNSITTSAGALAPAQGQYVYPAGAAHDDGADIFRAGVGLTPRRSIWRVDFNTLADPKIPIAVWTFDTDDSAATGTAAWPAQAHVSSPGIDAALVVSAQGARLLDASGATRATFPTIVDRAARSFVVRIPRRTLPVGGRWRVRLAAGLADGSGTAFAPPVLSSGQAPAADAARVYNVSFRSAAQEPVRYTAGQPATTAEQLSQSTSGSALLQSFTGAAANLLSTNFWGEDHQADALAAGDVAPFGEIVDWSQLARKRQTQPPLVHGWSDRWYAQELPLGDGVVASGTPTFVGRVQPYAVYVPSTYDGRRTVPLTWLLHSASTNYNQYGGVNPRFVAEICEARGSLCATPEGFGANGLYEGSAEWDFWRVWRQVALGFRVRTDRTVVSGYSMGGLGSFRLPHTYPSLFAAALPLDGGFDEGCTTNTSEGTTQLDPVGVEDRSPNVRWVPYVITSSYSDELSLYPGVVDQANRLRTAGDRFVQYSLTSPEHITTDALDGFSVPVAALGGDPAVKQRPGSIDYTWCRARVDPKLGLGPTSVYWLSGLAQRAAPAPSTTSHVVAISGGRPEQPSTLDVSASVIAPADQMPMQVLSGTWRLGPMPPAKPTLALTLTNVAALTIDTIAAGLPHGTATIHSDGPATVTLTHPRRSVAVPAGTTTVSW